MSRIPVGGMLFLLGVVTCVGCGEAAPEPGTSTTLAPEGLDLPAPKQQGLVPKWETAEERARAEAAKADGFDVRGTYNDIFGVTEAPRRVRAMAEFERSDAVLLAWQDEMPRFLLDMVATISTAAPVFIVTPDLEYSAAVRDFLERAGVDTSLIGFFEFLHESFWTRDYGPIPVATDGNRAAFVDHRYYPDRVRDDAVPTLMGRYFGVPAYRPDLHTEGGNFMTNGEGLCVATEWILEENPYYSTRDVQALKREYYGCERTVILERMYGEGTGHVDMFAKFISRDTVIVGRYDPFVDPDNAAILDRNAQRLAAVKLADGTPLRVERIPMPSPTYPTYRSYTNSLIVNDTVIVPTYYSDQTYEAEALEVYRKTMPGYRILTVDSDEVIEWGGAVHCTAMGFVVGDASLSPTTRF